MRRDAVRCLFFCDDIFMSLPGGTTKQSHAIQGGYAPARLLRVSQ